MNLKINDKIICKKELTMKDFSKFSTCRVNKKFNIGDIVICREIGNSNTGCRVGVSYEVIKPPKQDKRQWGMFINLPSGHYKYVWRGYFDLDPTYLRKLKLDEIKWK